MNVLTSVVFLAGRTASMNRHVEAFRFESFGDQNFCRRKVQIKNSAAILAMKVNVLLHIRTKPRRAAVNRDLPRQSTLHQRLETIVDSRHRNLRHHFFRAHENLICRRMIAFAQQHVIHLPTLLREPKAAIRKARVQLALNFFISNCAHCVQAIYRTCRGCQYLELF